jgi:hypothetical protein
MVICCGYPKAHGLVLKDITNNEKGVQMWRLQRHIGISKLQLPFSRMGFSFNKQILLNSSSPYFFGCDLELNASI